MADFACESMVIPDGRYQGRRFRFDRQPYTRLLYAEIDSGRWKRHFITGPTQSGKTYSSFVTPTMYHLFERRQTVICGVPTMDMVADKWNEDIRPAIEASKYRDLLPRKGQGSREASKVDAIRFGNNTTLKFMSGGGGDKKRAAFTAPVLVVTETDGMDRAMESSREADPITQLIGRTMSYGSMARTYFECTVSTETGRTWSEYNAGTASRIVCPCPHCGSWVTPEREHLQGWQAAENEVDASNKAYFVCPECQSRLSGEDRGEMNQAAKLVHKGQEITPEGEVVGDMPETFTLGFRWNAFHNLFMEPGDIGAAEWKAARSEQEDNTEKAMRQFWWALPHDPDFHSLVSLDVASLVKRQADTGRRIVPDDTECITVGVDVGDHLIHYMVIAWKSHARGIIVDYQACETNAKSLGVEKGILSGLRSVRDQVSEAFITPQGEELTFAGCWVDEGYKPAIVRMFCKESGDKFMPVKGHSQGGEKSRTKSGKYVPPKSRSGQIRQVGDGWHTERIAETRQLVARLDVDQWKSWVHHRLETKPGDVGSLVLYKDREQEHLGIARSLTSEEQIEEWNEKDGVIRRWQKKRPDNHHFDCCVYACAAGNREGVRVIAEPVETRPTRRLKPSPWVNRER